MRGDGEFGTLESSCMASATVGIPGGTKVPISATAATSSEAIDMVMVAPGHCFPNSPASILADAHNGVKVAHHTGGVNRRRYAHHPDLPSPARLFPSEDVRVPAGPGTTRRGLNAGSRSH